MLLRRSVHAAAQRQRSVDIRSLIVHEDNHVLIANKPSGLLCQKDRTCDSDLRSLVLSYLPTAYASLVHRLDRPASGCVIVAKTSKAAARLGAAFRARQVRKLYLAIVQGQPHESAAWLIDAMRARPTTNLQQVRSTLKNVRFVFTETAAARSPCCDTTCCTTMGCTRSWPSSSTQGVATRCARSSQRMVIASWVTVATGLSSGQAPLARSFLRCTPP